MIDPEAIGSERIRAAIRYPLGVPQLLLEVVESALPEPWNHELSKAEYGMRWARLRDVLERTVAQIELSTYTARGQDAKTYTVDHLLEGFAWDLDAVAERVGQRGMPPEDVRALADEMRRAAQGLRNYRAEPITDDGKVVIIGHTTGAQNCWPDKMRHPYLEYAVTVAEEVIELSSFDVLRHAYQQARRALTHKRRTDKLMFVPGPATVQIVIRQRVAR